MPVDAYDRQFSLFTTYCHPGIKYCLQGFNPSKLPTLLLLITAMRIDFEIRSSPGQNTRRMLDHSLLLLAGRLVFSVHSFMLAFLIARGALATTIYPDASRQS